MKSSSIFLFLILSIALSCRQEKSDPEIKSGVASYDGEHLAKTFCVSCHQFPEPDLLDKKSWRKYVLPRMGFFLGIHGDSVENFLLEKGPGAKIVDSANVFPKNRILDSAAWHSIRNYYLTNAPDSLKQKPRPEISKKLTQFKVREPAFKMVPPSVTYINIQEQYRILLGDANSKGFYSFDRDLKYQKAASLKESPVWMIEVEQGYLITVMGSFSPTDLPSGFLVYLPKNENQKPQVLINKLQRPVHADMGDLNGDGLDDFVICEFAKWTGSLSWWEYKDGQQFKRHILKNEPGAIKSYIIDYNHDQKNDIVALFGQGNEGIFLYENKGEGTFEEKRLIQFSPSHGSSYFNFYDFNKDGHQDIIYCAGDNADFGPILKPYHGIYIYMNDGNFNFSESLFYPLNGAYNAIPDDYDNDGDIDIAAISFFPDYKNHPEESFVYLENKGDFDFQAFTLNDPTLGRWIVMDKGDVDGDGDQDLAIGSLTFEVPNRPELVDQWVNRGMPFILLENTEK